MKRGMLWLIPMVAILVSYTVVHETIHSEISRYFGHDDCYFGTNGISVYQHCPDRYNTSYDIIEEMKLHSLNEIVGYHFMFGLWIYLVIEFSKTKKGDSK